MKQLQFILRSGFEHSAEESMSAVVNGGYSPKNCKQTKKLAYDDVERVSVRDNERERERAYYAL